MSTLAAYFDTSNVSFLFKKDKKHVELFNFPYVYSKGTLGNQCSENEYYQNIIDTFLTQRKTKLSSCDLVISGFNKLPELSTKPKFSVSVENIVGSSDDYLPIMVSNGSFVAPNLRFSYAFDTPEGCVNDDVDTNYTGNLRIYPQIITDDISIQADLDKELISSLPSDMSLGNKTKVLFSGARFLKSKSNKELIYILILSILNKAGVYDVSIDESNVFPLLQSMKMYDKGLELELEDYVQRCGTFISCTGAVECLLKTGVGEDQFFEIEKDRVSVFTLNLEEPAKLQIKNQTLGTKEINTRGGEVGIVFDTRTTKSNIYSNTKQFNDCIKQFGKGSVKN